MMFGRYQACPCPPLGCGDELAVPDRVADVMATVLTSCWFVLDISTVDTFDRNIYSLSCSTSFCSFSTCRQRKRREPSRVPM